MDVQGPGQISATNNPTRPLYSYEKLGSKDDLRLVTILPAAFDDDIVVDISHTPLLPPQQHCTPRMTLQELAETLPPNWEVLETLDNRFIFNYEDPGGSSEDEKTSWVHPTATFDRSLYEKPDRDQVLYEPRYEALSYTWGPMQVEETAYVKISGASAAASASPGTSFARLLIGKSLASAIRHLRFQDKERVLWIDAISINQSDINERDEQVARMTEIYSLAHRVVVWLGPGTENSRHALDTLEHLGMQSVHTLDKWVISPPEATELHWGNSRTDLPYSQETWSAIHQLLSRDWFERLWIMQEIQLAEDAILYCGRDHVHWTHFRSALLCLWNKQEIPAFFPRERLALVERLASPIHLSAPISNTFTCADGRRCKDPRDLIYGFVGLLPPSFRARIRPQYGLPVGRVYMETVLAHIQHVQRLELLRSCYLDRRVVVNTPTWVPDFSSPKVVARQAAWQFAAGFSRCWAEFCAPDVLKVAGVRCATVGSLSPPIPSDKVNVESAIPARLRAIRDLEPEDLLTAPPYVTGEPFKVAYAKTLIGNYLHERFPLQTLPDLETWVAQESANAMFGEFARSTDAGSALLAWHEEHAQSLLQGRPYMATEEGYIALGPPGAEKGKINQTPPPAPKKSFLSFPPFFFLSRYF